MFDPYGYDSYGFDDYFGYDDYGGFDYGYGGDMGYGMSSSPRAMSFGGRGRSMAASVCDRTSRFVIVSTETVSVTSLGRTISFFPNLNVLVGHMSP